MGLRLLAAFVLLLTISTQTAAIENELELEVGHRTDSLRWNIASDATGTATPNILSELTWSGVHSLLLSAGWRTTFDRGWHLQALGAFGVIYDGKNQDSDYADNNRTSEFSRSNNDTDGDNVWDATAAFGYRFVTRTERFQITPLAGVSIHEQNLRITNGRQTIPATGAFANLNSTYQARWTSYWVGMELGWDTEREARGFVRVEHHVHVDYYAQANWNLRSDFEHPKSFEHRADGQGVIVRLGVHELEAFGPWRAKFDLQYQRFTTDPGTDEVFFANGIRSTTRLNEVKWEAWWISGGLELRF